MMATDTVALAEAQHGHPQHDVRIEGSAGGRELRAQSPSRLDIGERTSTVRCFDDYKHHAVVEGAFAGRKTGSRSRLFLSNRGEGGCYLDHVGGQEPARLEPDVAHFVATCRDPVSGRDRAVVRTMTGNGHATIQVWGVDPSTSDPKRLYEEGWGELSPNDFPPERTGGSPDASLDGTRSTFPFVAADGTCVWQHRQRDREIFREAMAELRIGEETHGKFGELISALHAAEGPDVSPAADLPTRVVPTGTVRKWLRLLEGVVVFEGATYADDNDRKTWLVVQMFGTWRCDAEGVVLVLDRRMGVWRTIYDVPSGCSKSLNYPLRGMVVRKGRLYMSACRDCMLWSEYRDFAVDLSTHRVTALELGADSIGPRHPENPAIGNVLKEIDAR